MSNGCFFGFLFLSLCVFYLISTWFSGLIQGNGLLFAHRLFIILIFSYDSWRRGWVAGLLFAWNLMHFLSVSFSLSYKAKICTIPSFFFVARPCWAEETVSGFLGFSSHETCSFFQAGSGFPLLETLNLPKRDLDGVCFHFFLSISVGMFSSDHELRDAWNLQRWIVKGRDGYLTKVYHYLSRSRSSSV